MVQYVDETVMKRINMLYVRLILLRNIVSFLKAPLVRENKSHVKALWSSKNVANPLYGVKQIAIEEILSVLHSSKLYFEHIQSKKKKKSSAK